MAKPLAPPARAAARRRKPLSRERVLRAGIDLADKGGLDAVSMRKLGQALRVEAMSLYKHVAGKDDILDGIADLVMGDFEVPSGTSTGGRPSGGARSRPTRPFCATPGPAA